MAALEPLEIVRLVRAALESKHGDNVLAFDVRGSSGVTDYYVVASGASRPQLKALFDEAQHVLKRAGVSSYRASADSESGWLVLDYVDVVIHILSPEAREYYAIEELLARCPRIDP